MDHNFQILKITRLNILKLVSTLSDEQLLFIPKGFNNNIIWNMGHIISSGQKLTYGLAGLPLGLPESIPVIFAKGTDPKGWTEKPDIKTIKELLLSTPEKLEKDYKNGIFKDFKEYQTSYGYLIRNIEEAISFNNVHESLHFGVIMSLKKLV
jgi:hypothetical protein